MIHTTQMPSMALAQAGAPSPWVYLFSRFTSEALLFEALIIFTLCALYTAFWLLRKRKYGVVEQQVPAGVVKYYLNELIIDAEQLRAQLFGLLSGQGIAATPLANLSLGAGVGATAALAAAPAGAGNAQAMAALEAKLVEQAKQIEAFVGEKAKIEQELNVARAAKGGAAAGGDPNAIAKLQEKIAQLEGKLAEYSVIEDDLANLKRLQQENASLKSQLGGKGATPDVTAAAPAAAPNSPSIQAEVPAAEASTPAPAAAAPETAAAPGVAAVPAAEATAPATTAQASPAAAASSGVAAGASTMQEGGANAASSATNLSKPAAVATPGAPGLGAAVAQAENAPATAASFEGLVDQVEQSLQPKEAAAAPASGATQLSGPSTTADPTATIEKSDADLVAEFEKMLNG